MPAPRLPFVVVLDQADNGLSVTASGHLDFHDCEYFVRKTTSHLVRRADVATLSLDIGAVTYCDSAGLGALVQIQRACHTAGWTFVLSAVHPAVSRMLDMTGLTASFGPAAS